MPLVYLDEPVWAAYVMPGPLGPCAAEGGVAAPPYEGCRNVDRRGRAEPTPWRPAGGRPIPSERWSEVGGSGEAHGVAVRGLSGKAGGAQHRLERHRQDHLRHERHLEGGGVP